MRRKKNSATKPNPNGSPKPKTQFPQGSKKNSISKSSDEKRLVLALRRINLTLEQVQRCPPLNSILKESVGSVASAIEAMRLSSDPCVMKFLHAFDTVPDQKELPIEAIALFAGVNHAELLGATIVAFKSFQSQKSALMVMKAHPEILKNRIKFAKREHNVRDRDAIDTAVGFLPSPRGMSLNVNFGDRPKLGESAAESAELEIFNPINNDLEAWQANRTALLKDEN